MLKLTKTDYIDSTRYLDDLQYLGFMYVDREKLETRIKQMIPYRDTIKHLCMEVMYANSGGDSYSLESTYVVSYLKRYENCPDRYFTLKGKSSDSLDFKKVLTPLLEKGFATEFITLYREYKTTKYLVEKLNAMFPKLRDSDVTGYNGNTLSKMYFNYTEISNLRLSTHDENVQGIPKKMVDAFVAPSGYTIVSGDFKQADLRWAYSLLVKTKDNIKTMMEHDDKYEGFARILEGDVFDLDYFTEHRSMYKANILAPIYGAKSAMTTEGTKFIRKAKEELAKSPHYQEFLRRINNRVRYQLPLKITSYFGHTEIVNTMEHVSYADKDPVNFALNSSIQTGTSEIVKAVTNGIMDDFSNLGFTSENGCIYSYLNRHDEALFLVKNELLEYSYVFQKHQIVQVDNCIPFEIEFDFTKTYNVEDEETSKLAKAFFKDEYDETPVIDYDNEDYYIPTKDLLELSIGTHYLSDTDETVISMLDIRRLTCSFEVIKGSDSDLILSIVAKRIRSSLHYLASLDTDCALVYTTLVNTDSSNFDKIFIKFTNNFSNGLAVKSSIIAEFGAHNLLASRGVDTEVSSIVANSKEFLNQLVRNGECLVND